MVTPTTQHILIHVHHPTPENVTSYSDFDVLSFKDDHTDIRMFFSTESFPLFLECLSELYTNRLQSLEFKEVVKEESS